jgi:hypothetical protein
MVDARTTEGLHQQPIRAAEPGRSTAATRTLASESTTVSHRGFVSSPLLDRVMGVLMGLLGLQALCKATWTRAHHCIGQREWQHDQQQRSRPSKIELVVAATGACNSAVRGLREGC